MRARARGRVEFFKKRGAFGGVRPRYLYKKQFNAERLWKKKVSAREIARYRVNVD